MAIRAPDGANNVANYALYQCKILRLKIVLCKKNGQISSEDELHRHSKRSVEECLRTYVKLCSFERKSLNIRSNSLNNFYDVIRFI